MPNIKSSKQDVIRSAERHQRNQKHRGRARGSVRRARLAIAAGTEGMPDIVREAMSMIDRAARKGAIHPNAAARRKSRLARSVNAVTSTP